MSGTVSSWHWDFGDGQTSSEKNPVHQYKMPGTYLVTLTVIDYFGNTLTAQHYVYMYQWDYSGDGMNVSFTDKIFRLAVPQRLEQGIGWCEYNGEDYPYVEGVVGTCRILNRDEDEIQLAVDSRSFIMSELGHLGQWVDERDEYGGASEIESEILLPEKAAPRGASAILEHSQTHVDFKGWYKDERYA